ncbi:MAG: hypothetical protein K8R48_08180 [Alphaproteobacteria bacterium]|nr:hypothetical protein [Alphaproteobacteria bacterium]
MAQKRKTDQSKLDAAALLLQKLEEKTAQDVKARLGDSWRDNLFEIMMTRLDLAARHKKTYAAIPSTLGHEPQQIPKFARLFLKTMRRMLKLAKAPTSPLHVAAFGVLYASVVNAFLNDNTKDHAKTMAALDKGLGMFEEFAGYLRCR